MTPDVIGAWSTALVAILGAVTALIVALRGILIELKKNTAAAEQAAEVGQNTHDLVNTQAAQTDRALRAAGIPVPPAEGTNHGTKGN